MATRLVCILIGWALAQLWHRHTWVTISTNDREVRELWRAFFAGLEAERKRQRG